MATTIFDLHDLGELPSPEKRWLSKPVKDIHAVEPATLIDAFVNNFDPLDHVVQMYMHRKGFPLGHIPLYHIVNPLSGMDYRKGAIQWWNTVQEALISLATREPT